MKTPKRLAHVLELIQASGSRGISLEALKEELPYEDTRKYLAELLAVGAVRRNAVRGGWRYVWIGTVEPTGRSRDIWNLLRRRRSTTIRQAAKALRAPYTTVQRTFQVLAAIGAVDARPIRSGRIGPPTWEFARR